MAIPTDSAPSDLLSSILGLVGGAMFRVVFTPAMEALMAAIDDLRAKVDALKSDVDSASARSIQVATDLKGQIADLRNQLQAAGVPPEILAELDAISQTAKGIDPTDPTTTSPSPTPPPSPVPPTP